MTWVFDNLDLIWSLTLDHLRQSVIPIVLGFVIAIPVGWAAWRYTTLRGPVLTTIGLLYTIPSLGLFALLAAAGRVPGAAHHRQPPEHHHGVFDEDGVGTVVRRWDFDRLPSTLLKRADVASPLFAGFHEVHGDLFDVVDDAVVEQRTGCTNECDL